MEAHGNLELTFVGGGTELVDEGVGRCWVQVELVLDSEFSRYKVSLLVRTLVRLLTICSFKEW